MSDLAQTPKPPYYAVIFSSRRASEHEGGGATHLRIAEPVSVAVDAVRSQALEGPVRHDWKRQLDDMRGILASAEVSVPDVSQWSVGMHVHHCSLAMTGVCRSLIESTPPPPSSPFSVVAGLILLTGRIPRGRGRAPETALPRQGIGSDELDSLLRESERLLEEAADAPRDAWFRHFAFGVMDRDRTMRFLAIHNRHHARIISDILAA